METRRTLEREKPRDLKASELKVGFLVRLEDTAYNSDFMFVEKISDTEIVFETKIHSDPKNYRVILIRDGDKLSDAKGRAVKIKGNATQYDSEGKEI